MTLPELVKDYDIKQKEYERLWARLCEDWPRPHGRFETMADGPDKERYLRAKHLHRAALLHKDKAYNDLVDAEKLIQKHAFEAVCLLEELSRRIWADALRPATAADVRDLLAKVGHLIPKETAPCPSESPSTSPSKDSAVSTPTKPTTS